MVLTDRRRESQVCLDDDHSEEGCVLCDGCVYVRDVFCVKMCFV